VFFEVIVKWRQFCQ